MHVGDVMVIVLSCMHAHDLTPLLLIVFMHTRYIGGLVAHIISYHQTGGGNN
jgi:hypothetical protein